MTVSVSPNDEQLLRDAVATGRFTSEEEALKEALRLLKEQAVNGQSQNGTQPQSEEPKISCREKWLESFNAWVDKPRKGNPNMDDSRESIYE